MAEQPPTKDRLMAAVLNALTSGISPQTQGQILNAPSGAERFGASLSGLGQAVAGGAEALGQVPFAIPESILQSFGGNFSKGFLGQQQTQKPKDPNAGEATPEIIKAIETAEERKKTEAEKSKFIQRLVKLGVPLGAAIAGSLNPDILAQASGLATGFVGENQRLQEQQFKAQQTQADAQQSQQRDLQKEATDLTKVSFGDYAVPSEEELLVRRQKILDRLMGKTSAPEYSQEQLAEIEANMKLFPNKSKEEIIAAMRDKGTL